MIDPRAWHRAFAAAHVQINAFEVDTAGLVGLEFSLAPGRMLSLIRWADNPRSLFGAQTRYTLTCMCSRTRTLLILETDAPTSVLNRVGQILVNHGCLKPKAAP